MPKKIAVIGGGGKITTATMLELLCRDTTPATHVSLFGRTAHKIENTIALMDRFPSAKITTDAAVSLDAALEGADLVLYCASYGLAPYGEYQAFGVQQGAYLMGIAERMASLCPNAWLLVVTNPPDIPLSAIRMRFGLDRLVGLCNASVFTRKVLAAYLGCDEADVLPLDIGVNHELWYYDILLRGESVYDRLRAEMPERYSPSLLDTPFHREFPEWREGFLRNVAILRETGYLHAPVGGCRRFRDLPETRMGELLKRPTDADFEALQNPALTQDALLHATRRCAAEFPLYIADIVEALLGGAPCTQSALIPNDGTLSAYADDVLLQMTCRFSSGGVERPRPVLPEFVEATLASRIRQNTLLARALAEQDMRYFKQAALAFPERVPLPEIASPLPESLNAELWMSLN